MTRDVDPSSDGVDAPVAPTPQGRTALEWLVGVAALVAPLLHSLTDAIEWRQGGFSTAQLWLNYLAFLPMPGLLLGVAAIPEAGAMPQRPRRCRFRPFSFVVELAASPFHSPEEPVMPSPCCRARYAFPAPRILDREDA